MLYRTSPQIWAPAMKAYFQFVSKIINTCLIEEVEHKHTDHLTTNKALLF